MGKIKIVTDSTADLTKEQAEALGVRVVPLNIIFDGHVYRDGVDFTPETYIEKMESLAELPTSSQPAVGDFVSVFTELHEEDVEILAILISEKLSGTCHTAIMAGEMAEVHLTVFDSGYASFATQFQVLEAVRLANEGKSIAEIIERLTFVRDNMKFYLALEQLDNLVKGGRLSKTKAMISSVLNIKPILTIDDGRLVPLDKARSFGQAVKYLLKALKNDLNGQKVTYLGVTHIGESEYLPQLIEGLEEQLPGKEIQTVHASQVLTTHAGVGALALIYLTEK